jgi:hypothetical protein
VCRGRNAFFFTINRRTSVFELRSRGEQAEIVGVNVADCARGPQSDDFCENALLEVCQRCWFSSFYNFLPPLFDAHSHEWSSVCGVSPAVVWRIIFCECTASVARGAIMGPLLGAYLLTVGAVSRRMSMPFSHIIHHVYWSSRWWHQKWLKHACGDGGGCEWGSCERDPA